MAQSHILVLNSFHLRFYSVNVQIQSPTELHWTSSLWIVTGVQILVSITLHSDSASCSSSREATCCCTEDLPTQHTYSSLHICAVYIPHNRSKKNYHFTKSDILIWFVLKITELFFPQYLPRHVNCKSQVIPSASTQTIFVSIHYNTQLSYMFQPFCAIIKHTSYKSWTATVLAQLSILTNTH